MSRSQIKFVAVVVLILCFGFGASMVRSDAWDAFEARCLVPMEDFNAPDPDGLEPWTPTDAVSELLGVLDVDGVEAFIDPEGAYSMVTSEEIGCQVFHNLADETLWDKAQAWRDAALASGRYEPTDQAGTYFSTTWREPVFSVTLYYDAKLRRAVFTAYQTDLEA